MPESPEQVLQLTPPTEDAYFDDLRLVRLDDGRRAAVWVERRQGRECVCWRMIDGKSMGDVRRTPAVGGHPATPRICGDRVLWCELRNARGALLEARIAPDGALSGGPGPVRALASANCGETDCALTADGAAWLIVETWDDRRPSLRLLRDAGGVWQDRGPVSDPDAFCVRPRLCAGGDAVMASWDEYRAGRYRVATAELTAPGPPRPRRLPGPEASWETLSAVACSDSGRWFAARCRERLVAGQGGAALHHSELVVATLTDGEWQDVGQVNVDHAMNPWMSAYWGFRRFPVLVPAAEGVRLLWEEKQDVLAMGPGPGRLCTVAVTAEGLEGEPRVVLDERCMFVVEDNAVAPHAAAATKTQWQGFQWRLPYELHELDLDGAQAQRPSGLDSQRGAPAFRVRPCAPERPRPQHASYELFWGDPHLHSRSSKDLDGEQDELYHFARDVAALDFVAFTENDCTRFTEPLTPADWERIRRHAQAFNDPGGFTAFVGWEYTLHQNPNWPQSKHSHRCVLFPGHDGAIHPCHAARSATPTALIEQFRGQDVLLHHHHPMGYDITDDTLERNIEICSGWWNCMQRPEFVESLHGLLDRGLRLGFFGASDNHERNPGLGGALTGAWARANTREAVFEAFCERRIFATTGLRPDLRFEAAGAFMGGVTETCEDPVVQVRVRCAEPVRRIEIVRDGAVVRSEACSGCEAELVWTDAECAAGRHYYYAHVTFAGEAQTLPWNLAPAYGVDAWTSPVWVTRRA